MKYQLSNKYQQDEAFTYLTKLASQGAIVEVKKVNKRRSLPQNRYFYLCLGIFALDTGYTSEEAKTIFKRAVNSDIFVYKKNNIQFIRSSADIDTKEMTKAIDRWREWCGSQGIEIPLPNDHQAIMHYQNQIEKGEIYL